MGPRAGLDVCGISRLAPGFDLRTVQPVASRYTDYAIPSHLPIHTYTFLLMTITFYYIRYKTRGFSSSGKLYWVRGNLTYVCEITRYHRVTPHNAMEISDLEYNACSWNRFVNPLMPNDHNSGRTAPLTSKRCILYIYSTNIGTEYFKHGIYPPFFPLQNAVCFIILTYLVPVLFTFIYRMC